MRETTTQRKPTYEQAMALERGHAIARRNQRQRALDRQAQEQRERDAAKAAAEHVHRFGNWSYVYTDDPDAVFEKRQCACGDVEQRKVRL